MRNKRVPASRKAHLMGRKYGHPGTDSTDGLLVPLGGIGAGQVREEAMLI